MASCIGCPTEMIRLNKSLQSPHSLTKNRKPSVFHSKGTTMSEAELKAEIERLKAENTNLKDTKRSRGELTFKVSAKGAVSIYGMGRFPVTLYKEQWERLLAKAEDIKVFIKENESSLTTKEK